MAERKARVELVHLRSSMRLVQKWSRSSIFGQNISLAFTSILWLTWGWSSRKISFLFTVFFSSTLEQFRLASFSTPCDSERFSQLGSPFPFICVRFMREYWLAGIGAFNFDGIWIHLISCPYMQYFHRAPLRIWYLCFASKALPSFFSGAFVQYD